MIAPGPPPATSPWAGAPVRWAGGVLLALAVLAFLRGAGLPNLWAATHYAITWEHGFVKRGLLGSALQTISPVLTYRAAATVAYSVEVACTAFLCAAGLALVRSGERHAWAAMVFAASPGLLFFFHEVGYLDQVGALATLGSVALLPRLPLAPGTGVLLAAGALSGLCHEANLVLFGPLLAVAHAARYGAARDRRVLATSVGLLAAFGALVLAIGQFGTADAETAAALRASLTARCGFEPRLDVLLPVSHGGLPRPRAILRFWLHKAQYQEVLVATLLPALPAGLALLHLWRHEARRLAAGRPLLGLALTLAPLSPLALYLSGIDFQRWDALTLLTLTLAILAAVRLAPAIPAAALPARARLPLTVVVLLGVSCSYPLLSRHRSDPFPFERYFWHIRGVLEGERPWLSTPSR